MKHEYHEGASPTGQPTSSFGNGNPSTVSLTHHLLHGPKVDEFEIPRDSDTGREIELPDEGVPGPRKGRRR
jgi:hypothetical protein